MPIASIDSARSGALTNPELNGKNFKSRKTNYKLNYSKTIFRNTMDGFRISSNSVPSFPQGVNELKPVTLGQKIIVISAVLQTINFRGNTPPAINSSALALAPIRVGSALVNTFTPQAEKETSRRYSPEQQRVKRDGKVKAGPERKRYTRMKVCVSSAQKTVAEYVSKMPNKSYEYQLCSTMYDANRILNTNLDIDLSLSSDTTCLWECHLTSGQVNNNLVKLSRAKIALQQAERASGDDQQKQIIKQYLDTLDQAVNNAQQVADKCETLKKTEKEFVTDYQLQQHNFEMNCASLFNIEWPALPRVPNNPGYYGTQEILDLTREVTGKLEVKATEAYNSLANEAPVSVPGRIPILMARAVSERNNIYRT